MAKMNIILAVNAIKPPLTGIGRYTWELANRVPGMVDVSSVRFFFGGRWLNNVHSLLKQSPSRLAVRQRLLRSRVAGRLIDCCRPCCCGSVCVPLRTMCITGQTSICPRVPGRQSQLSTIFRFFVTRSFIRRSVLISCSARFGLH